MAEVPCTVIGEIASEIIQRVFAFLEFELRKSTLMDQETLKDVQFREAYFGDRASDLAVMIPGNQAIYPIYYINWRIDKIVGLHEFPTSHHGDEERGSFKCYVILRNKDIRHKTRRLRVDLPYTKIQTHYTYWASAMVQGVDLNKEVPEIITLLLEAEAE